MVLFTIMNVVIVSVWAFRLIQQFCFSNTVYNSSNRFCMESSVIYIGGLITLLIIN